MALLLGFGLTGGALALQVIQPEGEKGPFVLNFRFPHLFFAFYIDTPAEVSLDFEAGLREGIEPLRLKGYLNDRYTFDFTLQKHQRYGRYRLYLGSVLKGRHSLRIDLIQGNERKTPEAVLDRVRVLGSEPGDGSFSVLRHTPLYVIQPNSLDVPLFSRYFVREEDLGVELLYGLVMSAASDPMRLTEALKTHGLPFGFLNTLRQSISPFGVVQNLEIAQNGTWAPFEGVTFDSHPVLILDTASRGIEASPVLPKEGVFRTDPTLYPSLKSEAFLDGLPWMVTQANSIAKEAGALKESEDLSHYLFFRFHTDQTRNRGPFGLEVGLKSGRSLSMGPSAILDQEGVFGFALKLSPQQSPSDIVRFRVFEGSERKPTLDAVLDRLFRVDTGKGAFSWQTSGRDWHSQPSGFFVANPM